MKRMILIDSDRDFCVNLRSELNRDGRFNCCHSYTICNDALSHLAYDKPDIVIMDMQFKEGISAFEARRIIKKKMPQTEIIMLSDIEDERSIVEAITNGARGYILKRDGINEIIRALTLVSEHKIYINMNALIKFIEHFQVCPEIENPLTPFQTTLLYKEYLGMKASQIIQEQHISYHDLRYHIGQIKIKLETHSIIESINKALARHIFN